MSLTVLTWNLAMLERSAQAPHTWGIEHTEQAVRERVLECAPDMVLFQELPGMVPFLETHDMIRANPTTHQGQLATLCAHQLLADERRDAGSSTAAPVVTVVNGCAVLVTLASGLTVANVHLSPGPGATGQRLEQFADVVESSPTPHLLIIGDTNTRVDEIQPLADAGLVGAKPPKPTWDGKRNRFHADIPEFSAYFTRFFATEAVSVSEVKVLDRPWSVDEDTFYLSDHHGLMVTVDLL